MTQPTDRARALVVQYFNDNLNRTDVGKEIEFDDTYFYFFAYVLGGWKVYVSTTVPDNKIYEVTYDKEKKRTYLDCYVKLTNTVIEDDQVEDLREKLNRKSLELLCPTHNPVQHRDAKPKWCDICGLTKDFDVPVSRLGNR